MTSDSNIYAPTLRFKLMLLFQNPLWHGSSPPPQPKAGSGPCWGFELEQQWSKTQMNRRQLLSIFKIPEWGCVRLSQRFANNSNSASSLAMLIVLSSLRLTTELLIVQVWIDSEFSWIFLCLAGWCWCYYSRQLIGLKNLLVYSHFVWKMETKHLRAAIY